ncbi:MAG TPA: metallophosphoesterase [Oligoflexia bacterium]|nr:metallophosphoesterase [Oligoflexia bacterium]
MNYVEGVTRLSRAPVPVHHVLGNHDTTNLSLEELLSIIDVRCLYYSFDVQSFHFVVLYTHVPVPRQRRIILPEGQLAWLEEDLRLSANPAIVFSHHSFAEQDLTGNPWFEALPEDCLVENREEVRRIISSSGKVIAAVNGHLHWNPVDWHDGIPYITVQSATENFNDDGIPANTWGEMRIEQKTFVLEQFGNNPFSHTHSFC